MKSFDELVEMIRGDHKQREKKREEESRHAPKWPVGNGYNSSATLEQGVWVDDFTFPKPSPAQLKEFREAYWREHEIVKFTIVEGEQILPLGKNGMAVKVVGQRCGTTTDGFMPNDYAYTMYDIETGKSLGCFSMSAFGVERSTVVRKVR